MRAPPASTGTSRVGPSPTTRTRRGCSRAPTPGSRVHSRTTGSTRRTDHPALGSSTRAWRTNASRTDCARPAHGGGTRAAGDDPALGVDTGCTFPDRAALKTAVDNCLAVDPTGVACCSHGADCGAAGTVEMPDWDVSLVTSMSELFKTKDPSTRIYRDGITSSVTTMYGCPDAERSTRFGTWDSASPWRCSGRVQSAPIEMGRQLGHDHAGDVLRRQRIQHHAGGLGHIQSHGFYRIFLFCRRMDSEVHGRRTEHPPR